MTKILQSRDTQREADLSSEPTKGDRLTTSDLVDGKIKIEDQFYVMRFAKAEDWKIFRGMLESKRAAKPTGWRELPGGRRIPADKVLMLCTNCRKAEWLAESGEGLFCPNCNVPQYKDGGHLRRATKDEEAAWYKKETEDLARFKADAPKRAAELRRFNERVFADMGAKG